MNEQARFSDKTAASLMRLATVGDSRPIDDLLDRLHEPDGPEWFIDNLRRDSVSAELWPEGRPSNGEATLESLITLKQHAKGLAGTGDLHGRLWGTALYFSAIAIARVTLGERISSHSDSILMPLFADLAESIEPAWRSVFQRAAEACDDR